MHTRCSAWLATMTCKWGSRQACEMHASTVTLRATHNAASSPLPSPPTHHGVSQHHAVTSNHVAYDPRVCDVGAVLASLSGLQLTVPNFM
jgi:hypothetical protein